MSYIEIIDDSTEKITRSMSEYVKNLPTLMQWNLWLKLTRPDHATNLNTKTMLFWACVGCGCYFEGYPNAWQSKMRDNAPYTIRIGAMVRMMKEDRKFDAGKTIIEAGYVPRPVAKRGIGCPTCTALFHEEEKKVMKQHEAARKLDTINATIAMLSGCQVCKLQLVDCKCKKPSPLKFTTTTKLEPRLLMFESIQCGACKDTFHVWSKERETYVRCDCFTSRD